METIYFDYHATTPQDPRVTEAMLPFFHQFFANSSSSHMASWPVNEALKAARLTHANYLGASEKEIIFTSSATEANNLVFHSCFETYGQQKNELLLSPIEHKSVIKAAESLEKRGAKIIWLQVDEKGKLDLQDLKQKLSDKTLLVSVLHANNEIGTLQDLKSISKLCKEMSVFFHSDAVQSFAKYPLLVKDLGVDFLSWSAHKFYGPKGVGGLYFNSSNVKLQPQLVGGAHEWGLRAGTVNTAGVVEMAKALEIVQRENESLKVQTLRNAFQQGLCNLLDNKKITYKINGDYQAKLYNNFNITLLNRQRKDIEPKLRRICYSTGSACATGQGSPSHVLLAIGMNEEEAMNTFRFSFGKPTTIHQIEEALDIFASAL
jgi:cysteine desulfurase